MASTYSPLLRFELPASGEQAGLWGNTVNVQLGQLAEQAIAGVTTIALTSTSDRTLTTLSGTPDEGRAATLVFTGTPGGTTNILVPALQKTYHIRNTTPSQLFIKTPVQVGSGVAVLAGAATLVHCDGVNVYSSIEKVLTTQLAAASVNGGANSIPVNDPNGNLGLNTTLAGTWNSGGGAYSLPTGMAGFASIKPIHAMEVQCGAWWSGQSLSGAGSGHMGTAVNAYWASGAMKFKQTGTATLNVSSDAGWWWGYAVGNAGATANFQMGAYMTNDGLMTTRYNLGISDRRLKSNLQPITEAMAKVRQLVGYTFDMERFDKRTTGLIAQDVEKVLPEAVVTMPDGTLALAYGHLAGLFVNALNEIDIRMKLLEQQLYG